MLKISRQLAVAALAAASVCAMSLLSGCAAPIAGVGLTVHAQGATHPIEPDCQCGQGD